MNVTVTNFFLFSFLGDIFLTRKKRQSEPLEGVLKNLNTSILVNQAVVNDQLLVKTSNTMHILK